MDDAQRAERELAQIAPALDEYLAQVAGPLLVAEAKLLYLVATEVRQGAIVAAGSTGARPAVALGRGSVDGHGVDVFVVGGAPAADDGDQARVNLTRALVVCGLEPTVRLIELDAEAVAGGWSRPIAALWLGSSPLSGDSIREFERWAKHLTQDAFVLVEHRGDSGPKEWVETLAEAGQLDHVETVGRVSLYQVNEGADLCATA